jgi:hypothetical protein
MSSSMLHRIGLWESERNDEEESVLFLAVFPITWHIPACSFCGERISVGVLEEKGTRTEIWPFRVEIVIDGSISIVPASVGIAPSDIIIIEGKQESRKGVSSSILSRWTYEVEHLIVNHIVCD